MFLLKISSQSETVFQDTNSNKDCVCLPPEAEQRPDPGHRTVLQQPLVGLVHEQNGKGTGLRERGGEKEGEREREGGREGGREGKKEREREGGRGGRGRERGRKRERERERGRERARERGGGWREGGR